MAHEPVQGGTAAYGGAVTRVQFIRLATALCLGTLVEWYDFTIYTQLANVITKLFFPSGDPAIAQLSFWGVYAIGFISRPAGAVLFGHIGDYYGRRTTLLFSVLFITIPTLLIGCLPTFAHIGITAPILMAVLRFVQGLAVGGEFGSAITYLYEMGPAGHKGFTASLGQMAIAPGIILGILVCQAVLYGCSQSQLLLWGWRVPFLLTTFTGPLAVVMRMHMPEPYEYLQNRQEMVLQRVASTAAHQVARTYSRTHSSSGGGLAAFTAKTLSKRSRGDVDVEGGGGPLSPRLSARQVSLRLQRSVSITADATTCAAGAGGAAAAAAGSQGGVRLVSGTADAADVEKGRKQEQQQLRSDVSFGSAQGGSGGLGGSMRVLSLTRQPGREDDPPLPPGCEEQFLQQVEQLSGVVHKHIPLRVLFRDHWQALVLQVLLEAALGAAFYTFFGWAPPYIEKTLHVPVSNTLWAVLIAFVVFAVCCVLTGHFLCDSKLPKVWTLLAAFGVLAVASLPVLVCIQSGQPVAMWLLLPAMLGLCGIIGGLMTTVGPQIYPAAVRASGYNIGHNLTMSTFGGLSPLAISALSRVLPPPTNAAGVIIIITALISFCAGVGLIKVAPAANAACPAGAHQQHLEEQARLKQEQEQHQQQQLAAGL